MAGGYEVVRLSPERLDELKRIAEAAGKLAPGEWGTEVDKHGTLDVTWSATTDEAPDHFGWVTEYADPVLAAHIAAFDPPTVLALISRAEAAEARLAEAVEVMKPFYAADCYFPGRLDDDPIHLQARRITTGSMHGIYRRLTAGDFHRVRALLARLQPSTRSEEGQS